MEVNSKDLKALFISEPSLAVEYCQVIVSTTSNFQNFQEFSNYHSKNLHVSTCQKEWNVGHMSIHCIECGNEMNSCVCLECFLNGNHQGHNYYINTRSSGNCDCGDISQWKCSGFCSNHHGLEHDSHPENYLDEKLRTILTDVIFKASFASIRKLEGDNVLDLSIILDFLKSFIKFGDGFRRLVAISLTEKINFEKFMNHIFECKREFNELLKSFFGLLVNDELFKNNFSKINYKLTVSRIIPNVINAIRGKDIGIYANTLPWENLWFHSYKVNQMKYSLENWEEFIFKVLNLLKETHTYKGLFYDLSIMPSIFCYIYILADFVRTQTSDVKQVVFDRFVTEILAKGTMKRSILNVNDTIVTASFNDELPNFYFKYLYDFEYYFFQFLRSFKSDKNLKFDKLFEKLNESFILTPIYLIGKNAVGNKNANENEKFICKFIKSNVTNSLIIENNYKSFLKGASFFVSYPLFYSLPFLLRNDEICRVKIAQLLSLEKYQGIRISLGIACLKNVISMFCYTQSLVPKTNNAINWLYDQYVDNPRVVDYGIPLFIPLLQLTIGLQCNENKGINEFSFKEFFAFEMSRELGIFDDIDDEMNEGKKKQIIFSFLYLSILLVTERILFNFDSYEIAKEQIIFELKQGVSDLNILSNKYSFSVIDKIPSSALMNKIIHEVATVTQKSNKRNIENADQDVSFHLKEGIEVNFISAINSFNREKVLMNNEISKHPDKLIKMQQFEPEETYFFDKSDLNVRLKEFLATPTVLAIIYQTLRKSSESNANELNDHLAMNILILISKFVQDKNFQSDSSIKPKIKQGQIINYKSTIVDLITQLRVSVFNFTFNPNEGANVQNTLNKEAFDLFLRMPIASSNESPKSIIEILLEKGDLGKNVLNQMAVEIEWNETEKTKEDADQMKKERARKMKEDIITHFKSLSSSFSLEDEASEESMTQSSVENEVCSICSMETKDEVLCYPLYIYRTKLPFIFDKPPLVEMSELNAMREADVLQDEDILESTYILHRQDDDDDEGEEDEKIQDPEMIFAQILAQSPELDITDDLDEDEIRSRQNAMNNLHQSIIEKHQRQVQQVEERKNRRRQMKVQQLQEQREEQARKLKELENSSKTVTKRCTAGNLFVIQFGICQHLVHPNCVHKEDFTCPIDRSFKNGFLPNIDDLSDADIKNHENLKEALNLFINKFSMFFKSSEEKIIDVFVELVKSISGLITTFEVRLRSLPYCLDSKKNKILSRNLFLTAWHAYRMKGKPKMETGFTDDVSENVDSKLTSFQRFVKKLIETDDIEEEQTFKDLVKQFVQSSFNCNDERSEKELCLFLRRVCLVEHFLLNKKVVDENIQLRSRNVIDWDDILSLDSLSQKFNVTFHHLNADFEFKPFTFSLMPNEFIRFAQEPYNFPVDHTSQFTIYNILDYNNMISNYDDFGDTESKPDYLNSLILIDSKNQIQTLKKMFQKKNYPSVFLSIGMDASEVRVIDGKRTCCLRPFFLDKYGCTDVGFRRGQPLFLSEERYERFMDQILSGNFSSNLQLFDC